MKILILTGVMLLCAGCFSPQKAFVDAVDAQFQAITPEYVKYVDADAKLTDKEKAARHDTVDLLHKMILEAQK
jgi:hypothetical protein